MRGVLFAAVATVATLAGSARAGGFDELLAQLESGATVAAASCPCGDNCPCASGAVSLSSQVRAVRTAEQAKWTYSRLPNGGWIAMPRESAVVATATPVSWYSSPTPVSYGEPVVFGDCANGQCGLPAATYAPSTTYYTSGRYTAALPRTYRDEGWVSAPRPYYGAAPFRRIFGGGFRGSCGPGGCQ